MLPENSPWGTTRVNKRPLILLALAALVVCAIMLFAGVRSFQETNGSLQPTSRSIDEDLAPRGHDSDRMAQEIIGQPRQGLIPAAPMPTTAPTAPAEPVVPITSVLDEPPKPPPRLDPTPSPSADIARAAEPDEWQQVRRAALQQALTAPRTIRFDRERSPARTASTDPARELERVQREREQLAAAAAADPGVAYHQALQAAQAISGVTQSVSNPAASAPASNSGRNDLGAFARQAGAGRFTLPNTVEAAASPFVLQAGSVIPAVLDSSVNSELPGALLAHVSQPVYSSIAPHALLIPQGTQLFGQYSADIVFGQERLLAAWERVRFPSGHTLDIGAMPGTDGVGRSGFADQVNHHYIRIFGAALLMSLVTTGVTLSQEPAANAQNRISAGAAMSQALGLQFGQVSAQLLQKSMNIAPTIEIRSGYRFNIIVMRDIQFPGPYKRLQ